MKLPAPARLGKGGAKGERKRLPGFFLFLLFPLFCFFSFFTSPSVKGKVAFCVHDFCAHSEALQCTELPVFIPSFFSFLLKTGFRAAEDFFRTDRICSLPTASSCRRFFNLMAEQESSTRPANRTSRRSREGSARRGNCCSFFSAGQEVHAASRVFMAWRAPGAAGRGSGNQLGIPSRPNRTISPPLTVPLVGSYRALMPPLPVGPDADLPRYRMKSAQPSLRRS